MEIGASIKKEKFPKNVFSEALEFDTLAKTKEVDRIANQIIQNLPEAALNQLFEGYGRDLDLLLNKIKQETYSVLYGNFGVIKESNLFYLEKLTESIEETLRIENLNYFVTSVLNDFEVNWHHLEWGQLVMKHNRLAILAARGHGKSYYFSHALPLWRMYGFKRPGKSLNNPTEKRLFLGERGYIITHEMDLAEDLLEIVKDSIEANPILNEKLFPQKGGFGAKENWSKRSIRCKNGTRLAVKSFGSAFRGRHPGYIIIDDFIKDNVIYSETQRIKSIEYFHSVIMNAILPAGSVCVVGTPFHSLDLYGDLKKKSGWKVFEYPAIYPDGKLLWPNRYDWEYLKRQKEDQGNLVFSRELLVKPIVSDSSIFPWDILKKSFIGMDSFKLVNNRDSYDKKFQRVVVGLDFSISGAVGADYVVFTVWGIDEIDDMWLMYVYREKGKKYGEQIAKLKSINSNFRPDVMVAENNAFQQIYAEVGADFGLPIVPHTTGTDKHDLKKGLPGLAVLFERGKIHLPRGDKYSINMTDIICSEFADIAWTSKGVESVGEHDDICLSIWQASIGRNISTVGFGISFLD